MSLLVPRYHWLTALLAAFLTAAPVVHAAAQQPEAPELLFYMTGSEASFASFREHVDAISVVGPQVFSAERDGVVWGQVDPRVLSLAREHDVKVMPLIHNPGFKQEEIHLLLNDPAARTRAVGMMVDLAREHDFWGWQFDFENIHVSDRDSLTAFYRETAAALHASGFTLSIAVVPTNGETGPSRFHRYMYANWRGSFDLAALADAGDFLSLMTYAQHGTVTAPGPIAGLPWMREMLDYALAQGVPSEKISLGIPTYSGHWYPTEDDRGARPTGSELGNGRAMSLIERYDAEVRWLPEQGTSYAFWQSGGTFEWIFLENARSLVPKLELFRSYRGLRGVSVWVLGAEDPETWPMFRTLPGRR